MTTVFLIRHASHDLVGHALAGRAQGVRLSARGAAEAQALAEHLAQFPIAAVYSSPRERTLETAAPLAARLQLATRTDAAFDEVDFGEWTLRTFASLEGDPAWRVWVDRRSVAQPSGGERFADAQQRVLAGIDRACAAHAEEVIAIFSHCDLIKSALAQYMGMSLDHLERFEIAPASISVLRFGEGWSQVKLVNGTHART